MSEAVGREFKRKAKREAKRLAQIHTRKLMRESKARVNRKIHLKAVRAERNEHIREAAAIQVEFERERNSDEAHVIPEV